MVLTTNHKTLLAAVTLPVQAPQAVVLVMGASIVTRVAMVIIAIPVHLNVSGAVRVEHV